MAIKTKTTRTRNHPIIRDLHRSCKLPIHWNILDWTEFGCEYSLHIRYGAYYMCLYIHFQALERGVSHGCYYSIGWVTRVRAPYYQHHLLIEKIWPESSGTVPVLFEWWQCFNTKNRCWCDNRSDFRQVLNISVRNFSRKDISRPKKTMTEISDTNRAQFPLSGASNKFHSLFFIELSSAVANSST